MREQVTRHSHTYILTHTFIYQYVCTPLPFRGIRILEVYRFTGRWHLKTVPCRWFMFVSVCESQHNTTFNDNRRSTQSVIILVCLFRFVFFNVFHYYYVGALCVCVCVLAANLNTVCCFRMMLHRSVKGAHRWLNGVFCWKLLSKLVDWGFAGCGFVFWWTVFDLTKGNRTFRCVMENSMKFK